MRRALPFLVALSLSVPAMSREIESYAFGDALETNRIPTVASVESALAGKAPRSEIPSLPLSVTNGGTGASSAAAALANLGGLKKTGDTMTGELLLSPWTGISGDNNKRIVFKDHDIELVSTLTPDGTPVVTEGSGAFEQKLDRTGGTITGSISFIPSNAPGASIGPYEDGILFSSGNGDTAIRVSYPALGNEVDLPTRSGVLALTTDIPALAVPSTDASAQGKAADAKATGDELASKASQADVAAAVATLGADAAATAAWRIILADHQRRLDAIEDADGTDALTEAQAEELIRSRVDTAISALENEWGDVSGCIPVQTQETVATAISADASGVSVSLSPLRATRYYASGGSRVLGFSSFSGVGNNPCVLILDGFSAVTWPSGARVSGAYSSSSGANVYEVYRLGGVLYARRVYP